MKHVVSFSGGRTSAYLVHLMEQKRINEGWDVEYVFMDTGAEHPKTYEFIRNVVEHFGITLHCLRGNFNQPVGVGQGQTVDVVNLDDIGLDLVNGPMAQMMRKHGIPTVASAWCTTRMKEEVNNKYCQMMGWGERVNWIGYRSDEPGRYFGKSCWQELRRYRFHLTELHQIFNDALSGSDLMQWRLVGSTRDLIISRAATLKQVGLRYLCELEEIEKIDVLNFWKQQPFDLEIEEHLGNCVFCIKKSINKVALALRDEPEIRDQWLAMVDDGSGRLNKGSGFEKGVMYRGTNSIETIEQQFANYDREQLLYSIKSMRDTNVCANSCEAFGQVDLFEGYAA